MKLLEEKPARPQLNLLKDIFMNSTKAKGQKLERRHNRVRAKISGTALRPRLSVKRSLNYVSLQLIDDVSGKTLVAATSRGIKVGKDNPFKGKTAEAYEAGLDLAKKALDKKITAVCFDRGGSAYHGRVKAVADAARAGGLQF